MSLYQAIRRKIFKDHNPYQGFPSKEWSGVWYNDQAACRNTFKRAIDMANPHVIVEVGSFVGESAIFMADYIKSRKLNCVIICVDTWCGGIDHWEKVPEKLKFWFGRPSLFYQFMGNVIERGASDVIIPLSMDSINAARLLKMLDIYPDLVYVDASHEEGDVLRDYEAYWSLLHSGGILLVDDLTNWFPSVIRDWDRFIANHNIINPIVEGEKGLIVKP